MDTFKRHFFPKHNKYNTSLSPNQWFVYNLVWFLPRLLWLVMLGITSMVATLTALFILLFILMYLVVGFYLILSDFFNHYDIVRTGGNCILFVLITSGLVTCLLPPSNIIYLTYLASN